MTSGRGPFTHALLCPSLGAPWTPSHSAGLWVLGPGLRGPVGTGTVPGAPRGDSTPLLLPVGKQRYGEVRRLARGPVARAAEPSVLEPRLYHPHPWLQLLGSCVSGASPQRGGDALVGRQSCPREQRLTEGGPSRECSQHPGRVRGRPEAARSVPRAAKRKLRVVGNLVLELKTVF